MTPGRLATKWEVRRALAWMWIKRPFRKVRQWWCGFRTGHTFGADRGWLVGSKVVDRWCRDCDKHIQIPLAEDDYSTDDK